MKNIKNIILSGILSILMIIAGVFGYIEYKENKQYEAYLSLQVLNNFSMLIYGTIESNDLLEEVIESKSMTHNEFNDLNERLWWIIENGQVTSDLARIVSKDISDEMISAASKIQHYLNREFKEKYMNGNNIIKLSKEQTMKLKRIKSLNTMWVNQIEKNLKEDYVPIPNDKTRTNFAIITEEFRKSYCKNGINRKEWISCYIALSQITYKNQELYESLY